MVVGERTVDAGPVLVAVDGTSHSRGAVVFAFEEAALRGADLVAVHVGEARSGHGDTRTDGPAGPAVSADPSGDAETVAGYEERLTPVQPAGAPARPARGRRSSQMSR
ncbi:universal stress protein [Streptomyces sp. AS58]|uniref:universal stress protein n=1 Tax=Streptomyces sp. AS58 TaxID=1519489 RepID=UPI00099BB7D0|nr:universal stress protein [Streptomyces sp. AS58]